MSADHLLCQIDNSGHSNEWFDFDNSFDFDSGYLDCDPNAVNSISPEDYTLPLPDVDANWDLSSFCAAPAFPDLVNYEVQGPMGTVTPNGPTSMFDPLSPHQAPFDSTVNLDCAYGIQGNPSADWASSIRHMVEDQAAADPSCLSTKAKRRDAGIAIHLQRLHDSAGRQVCSDSTTSSSSPWSDFVREEVSPTQAGSTITHAVSTDDSATVSPEPDAARGVELVLDLNMNAPANLPRKQKPRSQAQKDNYIKARKHGACEKHRKQHKRCNCLDKNVSRISLRTATAETTQPEIPRPQGLQVKTAPPGRSAGQSRPVTRNPTPSSPVAHVAVPAQSNPTIPSLEGFARRPLPSARRSAGSGNPARPGLQTFQQYKHTQPRHGAAGPSPSVPGVLPNQSIPRRLPRQIHSTSDCDSAMVSSALGHRYSATQSQTPCQNPGGLAARTSTRLETPGQAARFLTEYIAAVAHRQIAAFSSFWNCSAITSWLEFSLGKAVLFCCKQHFAARKGLELYR